MSQTNPDSFEAVRPELTPGEAIVWTGKPEIGVIFHREDALLIPFSLLWGGFAIFWEMAVSGRQLWGFPSHTSNPSSFGMIWGAAFVLIGQYLIWGRFIYAAWQKRSTLYAVTNLRVIAMQTGWPRRIASAYIESLPALIKEIRARGIGTLRFTPAGSLLSRRAGWTAWSGSDASGFPSFADVADVDALYQIVAGIRAKEQKKSTGF